MRSDRREQNVRLARSPHFLITRGRRVVILISVDSRDRGAERRGGATRRFDVAPAREELQLARIRRLGQPAIAIVRRVDVRRDHVFGPVGMPTLAVILVGVVLQVQLVVLVAAGTEKVNVIVPAGIRAAGPS